MQLLLTATTAGVAIETGSEKEAAASASAAAMQRTYRQEQPDNTHRKSRTRCPDNGKAIWAVGLALALLTCLQLKTVSADEESQDFQRNSEYKPATVLRAITITANDCQERESPKPSYFPVRNELVVSPQIIEGKSHS